MTGSGERRVGEREVLHVSACACIRWKQGSACGHTGTTFEAFDVSQVSVCGVRIGVGGRGVCLGDLR